MGFLVLQRVAFSVGGHAEWFAVLEGDLRGQPPLRPEEGTRWATIADLDALRDLGRDEALVRDRFAQGDRAALLQTDQPIASSWYRSGWYDEQGILFELGPAEVWGYDGWVASDHRGRGHYAALIGWASAALASEGVSRVLVAIDHLNRPSLRAARASGRRPLGSVWMVRAFGVSVRRVSWHAWPRWQVYRGARPVAVPPGRRERGEGRTV